MSQSRLVSLAPHPRVIFTPRDGASQESLLDRTKDQNRTFVFAPRTRHGFFIIKNYKLLRQCSEETLLALSFPATRPNRLRLPCAPTSTTAPVTMTTSPSLAWPSPSRPKSSCTSKRLVACVRVQPRDQTVFSKLRLCISPCRNSTTTGG